MEETRMLLTDFPAFSNNEVEKLMERISEQYFRKLGEKEVLRKKMQRRMHRSAQEIMEVIGLGD